MCDIIDKNGVLILGGMSQIQSLIFAEKRLQLLCLLVMKLNSVIKY